MTTVLSDSQPLVSPDKPFSTNVATSVFSTHFLTETGARFLQVCI